VFLEEVDYLRYLGILAHYARQFCLGIEAYCLMTNHIHIVGIPEHKDSIGKVFRDCHWNYAAEFNEKYGKVGHLWQARPFSSVLDETHERAAVRYVERNPVRAGIVARAEDYRWSSAPGHCGLQTDPLLNPNSAQLCLDADWSVWLSDASDAGLEQRIRRRTYTGLPCGDETFIKKIEIISGRRLTPEKPGPKPRRKPGENRLLWTPDERR